MKYLQNILSKHFLAGIVGVSLVTVLSALLLFVANNPLKQSQDSRGQAAIPEQNTIAEIKTTPASTSINVGDQSSFTISGSTGGSDTYGFQFVATIDTTNIENVVLTAKPQANLTFPVATVTTKSATQSEIVIFATNPSITTPVNISSFQDLAVLSFKAKSEGTAVVSPQDSNSKVLAFGSGSSLNLLKPMSISSIVIADIDQPNPTPTPTPSPTPPSTDNPNPTPTPTPTPTPDPGIGGYTVQSCNGDCSSNRECAGNLACYNGKCRLPINTGNTACQPPDTGSGSLSSCNQYCASSNDCNSSLVCWYNQCRNPLNVESPSCANKTVAQTQAVLSSCNQACSTHQDCATSLRCYYGACRAATNPTSTSCALVPTPTATPAPARATPTPAPTATASAVIVTPPPSATPAPLFDEPADQSALGAVQQYIANFWKTGDRTQVMIVLGLAVLMVIGLIALLVSLLSPRRLKPPTTTHRTPPPPMPPPTLTMQQH